MRCPSAIALAPIIFLCIWAHAIEAAHEACDAKPALVLDALPAEGVALELLQKKSTSASLSEMQPRKPREKIALPPRFLLDYVFGSCSFVSLVIILWALMVILMPVTSKVTDCENGSCATRLGFLYRGVAPAGFFTLQLFLLFELGRGWGSWGGRMPPETTEIRWTKGGAYIFPPVYVSEVLQAHFDAGHHEKPCPNSDFCSLLHSRDAPGLLETLLPGLDMQHGSNVHTFRMLLALLRCLATMFAACGLLLLPYDQGRMKTSPSGKTRACLVGYCLCRFYFAGLTQALTAEHDGLMVPWICLGVFIISVAPEHPSWGSWLNQWLLLCCICPYYFNAGIHKFKTSTTFLTSGASLTSFFTVLNCWCGGHSPHLVAAVDNLAQQFHASLGITIWPFLLPAVRIGGGVLTMLVEVILPAVAWLHQDLRLIFLLAGYVMHLGIYWSMKIEFALQVELLVLLGMGLDFRQKNIGSILVQTWQKFLTAARVFCLFMMLTQCYRRGNWFNQKYNPPNRGFDHLAIENMWPLAIENMWPKVFAIMLLVLKINFASEPYSTKSQPPVQTGHDVRQHANAHSQDEDRRAGVLFRDLILVVAILSWLAFTFGIPIFRSLGYPFFQMYMFAKGC